MKKINPLAGMKTSDKSNLPKKSPKRVVNKRPLKVIHPLEDEAHVIRTVAKKFGMTGHPHVSVASLFPMLKIPKPDTSVFDALTEFVKNYPEYVLKEVSGSWVAVLDGEDWTAELRSDVDVNLYNVYQHQITTYCPTITHSGRYLSTPTAALLSHSLEYAEHVEKMK